MKLRRWFNLFGGANPTVSLIGTTIAHVIVSCSQATAMPYSSATSSTSLYSCFLPPTLRPPLPPPILQSPPIIHHSFLTPDEISSIVLSVELDYDSHGTYYGPAVLPASAERRIRDLGGTCLAAAAEYAHQEGDESVGNKGENEEYRSNQPRAAMKMAMTPPPSPFNPDSNTAIMTQLIERTTDLHRDCLRHGHQSSNPKVASEGDVAFIFLTSSPSAYFSHGPHRVPAVAGTLVQFQGDVTHQTVIPLEEEDEDDAGAVSRTGIVRGVRIAGPFLLQSAALDYVGSCPEECNVDADCGGGEFYSECVCPSGRRNFVGAEKENEDEGSNLVGDNDGDDDGDDDGEGQKSTQNGGGKGSRRRTKTRALRFQQHQKKAEAKERALEKLRSLSSVVRKGFLRDVVSSSSSSSSLVESVATVAAAVSSTKEKRSLKTSATRYGHDICICKEAIGACRLPPSSSSTTTCYDALPVGTCIVGLKGIFQGGGTLCSDSVPLDDDASAIVGACCFQDRRCLTSQETFCETITPGYYLGPGTTCGACPKTEEYGACCMADSCKQTPVDVCDARGGVFKGLGTTCEDDCYGSCCTDDDCTVMTEIESDDMCVEGTFIMGGDCMPGTCPSVCEKALESAIAIPYPSFGRGGNSGNGNVSIQYGDTATGISYKDSFFECGNTILRSGGVWYDIMLPSTTTSSFSFDSYSPSSTSAGARGPYRKVVASTCGKDTPGAFADHESSLSVYEGSCGDSLRCVDTIGGMDGGTSPKCFSDGANSGNKGVGGYGATISWCARPGRTYRILVHGFGTYCSLAEGKFALTVKDDGQCGDGGDFGVPLISTGLPAVDTHSDDTNFTQTSIPANEGATTPTAASIAADDEITTTAPTAATATDDDDDDDSDEPTATATTITTSAYEPKYAPSSIEDDIPPSPVAHPNSAAAVPSPSPPNCVTSEDCVEGECCSKYSWCGKGPSYCEEEEANGSKGDEVEAVEGVNTTVDSSNNDGDDDKPEATMAETTSVAVTMTQAVKDATNAELTKMAPMTTTRTIADKDDDKLTTTTASSSISTSEGNPSLVAPLIAPSPSPPNCVTSEDCVEGECCSKYGWCGKGPSYCEEEEEANGSKEDKAEAVEGDNTTADSSNNDGDDNKPEATMAETTSVPVTTTQPANDATNTDPTMMAPMTTTTIADNEDDKLTMTTASSSISMSEGNPSLVAPLIAPSPSPPNCVTSEDCVEGECCSKYGWCGKGPSYCEEEEANGSKGDEVEAVEGGNTTVDSSNNDRDDDHDKYDKALSSSLPRCGKDSDCADGKCCSSRGWCGEGTEYCGLIRTRGLRTEV